MFKKMLTLGHLVLMAFLVGICLAPNLLSASPVGAYAPLACNLPAPANLQTVIVSTNSISVDWDDVPGAIGYRTRAANAVTGQVYYDAVSVASATAVTGLPASTAVNISVWAICPNGDLGDASQIQAVTLGVVVDDIALGVPSVNPITRINDCEAIPYPLCLVVAPAQGQPNPNNWERFYIETPGDPEVLHDNLGDGRNFNRGWYFGSEIHVPFNGHRTAGTLVYVYKVTGDGSPSLGLPVMAFHVDNTDGLKICYPPNITVNGYIIPNDQYRVWMGCGSGSKNPASSPNLRTSPLLQTSPNPFQDVLNVVLDDANASEVSLMDASGRVVRSQSVAEGTQTLSFETADLAPGLYLLRCQGPNTVKTTKVIKSR